MFGLLLSLSVLALAPLPAQAKTGRTDDRIQNCNWNRPGVNPFMGDIAGAVDRYADIPAAVRERLKQRMRERNFDEFVTISRDAISGNNNYDARISDMHFGSGRVCREVSRAAWTADMKERGLVYCEQGHCILVPTICRNVSRISRVAATAPARATGPVPAAPSEFATAPAAPEGGAANPATPFDELHPGAGAANAHTLAGATLAAPFWMRGGGGMPIVTAGALPVFSGGDPGGSGGTVSPTVAPTSQSPVPEPGTWGMLLAGLACVACAAHRKRAA